MTDEFEEIAHAGGKIEFLRREGGTAFRYSHSTPTRFALFFVAASYDGVPIHYVAAQGIGVPFDQVRPSILAPVVSDREGMFGRKCPRCEGYFRTSVAGPATVCPYCEERAETIAFLTENQRQFIRVYCATFLQSFESETDVVIDLDKIADDLADNRQAWVYVEERQQQRLKCSKCGVRSDVLGSYVACPNCAHRTDWATLDADLRALRQSFEISSKDVTGRQERGAEWARLIVAAIAAFESAANHIRDSLLRLPHTPRRRLALEALSFQTPVNAATQLKDWFGFDLLAGISDADLGFLTRISHRRHLLAHRGGIVDDEYIRNTGDTTVKRGQRIRVPSEHVPRLIALLATIGERLATEHASMESPEQ